MLTKLPIVMLSATSNVVLCPTKTPLPMTRRGLRFESGLMLIWPEKRTSSPSSTWHGAVMYGMRSIAMRSPCFAHFARKTGVATSERSAHSATSRAPQCVSKIAR